MVDELESEIRKPNDTKAQYLVIPRDIVMDSNYPFEKEADSQRVIVRIDKENNVLIVSQVES